MDDPDLDTQVYFLQRDVKDLEARTERIVSVLGEILKILNDVIKVIEHAT